MPPQSSPAISTQGRSVITASRLCGPVPALRTLFPAERLVKADYAVAFAFIGACFLLFFHHDIWGVGWDSLNFLFGKPLEFYDNCKKIRGAGQSMYGTPYPPTLYAIFAVWLLPLKLVGVITGPETFSVYLTYWLKLLTAIAYCASAALFYRIAREYSTDKDWAKFATAAWLTMPLALFSEFIFSQYDIFYVLLIMAGFLMFLRGHLLRASLFFGLSITFKYFPTFVFVPLLLLHEKRLARIAAYAVIFLAPTLLINWLFGDSPGFVEGVRNFPVVNRIYDAFVDLGSWRVYYLFAGFTIVCGLAYFTEATDHTRARIAAYFWLTSAILGLAFIVWHPQWGMFISPAIVLTSLITRKAAKFLLLDLAGMFFFTATVALFFTDNVDAALFRGGLWGLDFANSYLMAKVFNWFRDHSANVFLSCFWAYLALQVILKFRLLVREPSEPDIDSVDYGLIRQRFYVGLLIFLVPASIAIAKDLTRSKVIITNNDYLFAGRNFGELRENRSFEQTFIARGKAITQVSMMVFPFDKDSSGNVSIEIVDSKGTVLGKKTDAATTPVSDDGWRNVVFEPIPVTPNAQYRIRLTAQGCVSGKTVTWWGSVTNSYGDGEAFVDGIPQKSDFAFKVFLDR